MNISKEDVLELNVRDLTEQLYASYARIAFLNQEVAELQEENKNLKAIIENLAG